MLVPFPTHTGSNIVKNRERGSEKEDGELTRVRGRWLGRGSERAGGRERASVIYTYVYPSKTNTLSIVKNEEGDRCEREKKGGERSNGREGGRTKGRGVRRK